MTTGRIIGWSAGILALAAISVFYFVDPAHCQWTPKCVFHQLTGWQCPGCGVSRAIHALLHGRFAEALSYNYFFIISVPYFLTVCAVLTIPALYKRDKLRLLVTGYAMGLTYVILFCIWWLVRNIFSI